MPWANRLRWKHALPFVCRQRRAADSRGCLLAFLIISTLILLGIAFLLAWYWWNVRPALFWGLGYLSWAACDLLLLPSFRSAEVGPAIFPQAFFLTSIFLQMHGLQERVGEARFALRTRFAIYLGVVVLTAWLLLSPNLKWIVLSIRLAVRLALTGIALAAMRRHLNQWVDRLLFVVVAMMTVSITVIAILMIHASMMSQGGPIPADLATAANATGNIIGIAFALAAFLAVILDVAQHYRNEALLDSLTGLPNRRQFDVVRSTEWRRAAKFHQPLSLLLIDVDLFKLYNDTYGHMAGDKCLIDVADAIRTTAQPYSNLCVRLGGEEFVVLLPGAQASNAAVVAEEICWGVRNMALPHKNSPYGIVTVSVGVATIVPTDNDERVLFEAADAALYKAKDRGRNCVEGLALNS